MEIVIIMKEIIMKKIIVMADCDFLIEVYDRLETKRDASESKEDFEFFSLLLDVFRNFNDEKTN